MGPGMSPKCKYNTYMYICWIWRTWSYNCKWITIITRTCECLVSLGRTHELCLCRDISRVWRTREIALHKEQLMGSPTQTDQTWPHCDVRMDIHRNIITHCDSQCASLATLWCHNEWPLWCHTDWSLMAWLTYIWRTHTCISHKNRP